MSKPAVGGKQHAAIGCAPSCHQNRVHRCHLCAHDGL